MVKAVKAFVPLAMALFLTSSPRRTLRLSWPAPRYLALAVDLALSLNPLINELRPYVTRLFPVSEELKQAILSKIRTDRHVQEIDLETEVRPEMIGGFMLEIGDELIDASVAFDLNKIKQQFQNNDFIYKIR